MEFVGVHPVDGESSPVAQVGTGGSPGKGDGVVSPPSPEEKQDPGTSGVAPTAEAFELIPEAGPGRELTPAELAVITQMVTQAKDARLP